jgi:hypothetical protein
MAVQKIDVSQIAITGGNTGQTLVSNGTAVYWGDANNVSYLNGQPASYYTNATNISTGTLPYAQIPANIINTTANFTISGVHTYNANIVIGTSAGISANGSFGTAGQVLSSNGSAVYWGTGGGGGGVSAGKVYFWRG